MLTRYKLTFEYDGTDFYGWQKQPEGRTVQGVIEEALSIFYQDDINIVGQGRTDSGVHAKGQVAHVDLTPVYNLNRLYRAMRGLLPKDVALVEAQKVQNDFHARFHAHSRTYQYTVLEKYSPLMRNYSWSVFKTLSFERIQDCAHMIIGEHDFINFCIPPEEKKMTSICEIYKSEWKKQGNVLTYNIQGNRFLRHLVRRLVGTMVQVADGTLKIEDFKLLLSGDDTDKKGHSAPAKGLTLIEVSY